MAAPNNRPWLVFYGTSTGIVHAETEDEAFEKFLKALDPLDRFQHHSADYGGLVPPTRDEVRIRRPTESDRGWIEGSGDARFLALLKEIRTHAKA